MRANWCGFGLNPSLPIQNGQPCAARLLRDKYTEAVSLCRTRYWV
jgi:hypothetical protein